MTGMFEWWMEQQQRAKRRQLESAVREYVADGHTIRAEIGDEILMIRLDGRDVTWLSDMVEEIERKRGVWF